MKENQEIENQEDVPSLDTSFDYTKLNELIKESQEQQKILNEILENQKIIIDYFVPTEEEIKKQKQEEQKKNLEEQKLQEQLEEEEEILQQELEKEKTLEEEYNQEVLTQLTTLNENISKVEFVNQNTNAYLYILCFGFLLAFVMSFIYKSIKKFF